MSWEVFQRRGLAAGNRHPPETAAREFRVYKSVVSLTRAAAEVSGLSAGASVLVLFDREASVILLNPAPDPDGWRVCAGASGTLVISLSALLRNLGVPPGRYPPGACLAGSADRRTSWLSSGTRKRRPRAYTRARG